MLKLIAKNMSATDKNTLNSFTKQIFNIGKKANT